MFTRDDLTELVSKKGRDEITQAVSNIPEEDVRTALALTVALLNKNAELEHALWNQKDNECKRLQKELDKALTEIEKLKNA